MAQTLRILLVGGGAREHAIGEALCRREGVQLFVVANNDNPGLSELSQLSQRMVRHDEKDVNWIAKWAHQEAIDLAVIGLEDPLDAGLPDALSQIGVPTVGPTLRAARLEMSKLFTRELMRRHNIPGQVEYHYFSDASSVRRFLPSGKQFALKPVGLTAGKGVKVMGVHLGSVEEAVQYAQTVIQNKIGGAAGLVVEERLFGEEFTLQAFADGDTVLPMPLVKDYKRALEGDLGPNTGSMGSYSQPDGLLPFLTERERDQALEILQQIDHAVNLEGCPYRGVIYGQFMVTAEGVKLIEINARFGDPEGVNVLPLLENDFVDVCLAITQRNLRHLELRFAKKATVCKYITPPGYGVQPRTGVPLRLDRGKIEALGVKVFFAKVEKGDGELLTTSSRSIALLGIADSVEAAEASVEKALVHVQGEYHVRHDIGKIRRLPHTVTADIIASGAR